MSNRWDIRNRRKFLIIVFLLVLALIFAGLSYACIPTDEPCRSRRYSMECMEVDQGAGGRCIFDNMLGFYTCCVNPDHRVCDKSCASCRELDYAECECVKVPDGSQDNCVDTHYCIDGFCAPKPAPEECSPEGDLCGFGQPVCCPGTTCDYSEHFCVEIIEEPPERCYCEDNCNIYSDCEMATEGDLLCPADYCEYETPGELLDALLDGEEVPLDFIIEVIGQIGERLGSELSLWETDDILALIHLLVEYAESLSGEEFEQIANELGNLTLNLSIGTIGFNLSIPEPDACELRLIETPDEDNLFRTTWYLTADENDHDKWFANVTPYCPVDETKGFYEAVQCYGSGIGENGGIYRYYNIQPEKEDSPYLDPEKDDVCSRGLTKTGTNPTRHRTVAADFDIIPESSVIYIDWPDASSNLQGYYQVEDTGYGGPYWVDIYLGVGLDNARGRPPDYGHIYQILCNDEPVPVNLGYCG